jgi:hypothetical protein
MHGLKQAGLLANKLLQKRLAHLDMILHIHSDASYFSGSHARICFGGLLFCGYKPPNEDNLNWSILNVEYIIKSLVASAAE